MLEILAGIIFLALHLDNYGVFPPPLSADDEEKYLKLLASGDKKAKDILVKHNLRLVAHILKKFNINENDNEELISVGTLGLIKAVNSFDCTKGVRLATYASRCIENEILMFFRGRKKTALDISLDEPIETDAEGNPLTLIDIISIDDNVADECITNDNIKLLYRFVNEIKNERERSIIIMRYGLDGKEPKTQNEIASMYGISRSYVSRLETKIIKKLRKKFDVMI